MSVRHPCHCALALAALMLPVATMAFPLPVPGAADELAITFTPPGGATALICDVFFPEGGESLTCLVPFNPGVPIGSYDAFLTEPGSPTLEVSDQIHAVVAINSITVLMTSDIPETSFGPCGAGPLKCVEEDGTMQDITTALFGTLPTAGILVFAFSDIEDGHTVAEPATIALLGLGLAGLGLRVRRTRCAIH